MYITISLQVNLGNVSGSLFQQASGIAYGSDFSPQFSNFDLYLQLDSCDRVCMYSDCAAKAILQHVWRVSTACF